MGELIFFSWIVGIVSAWEAQNVLMLALLIGGPVAFLVAIRVASRPQAVAARLTKAWKASEPVPPSITMPKPIERPEAPAVASPDPDEWRPIRSEGILEGFELGEPKPMRVPADERLVQLQLEVHRLRGVVASFEGDAVAHLRGRVCSWRGQNLALAVPNGLIGHQAIFIRVEDAEDRSELAVGVLAELVCRWSDSRLVVERVLGVEGCDEPLPKLPQMSASEQGEKDGQLPTIDELNKQSKGEGWGHLNHSAFRVPIAWHLTTAPKGRAKAFEGKGREVQAILRAVAEAEGLRVIAVAVESDHIHLLGLPAGPGGMPPSWTWARWVGRFKALTSKRLKSLPGLEAFEWQTGYALTSVSGGRQGAEDALAVVRAYVEGQGEQG